MSLPQIDFTGMEATITMTEFRAAPGDVIDRVARGAIIHVTKNGKRIATISQPETIIHSDGTWEGRRPLLMGMKL